MPSTTSGSTSFSLDVDDVIEQALEPLGGEHTSGIDAAKARRALNLILIQMQNKNIPLNKLDTVTVSLTDGTQEYTLDTSIIDVQALNLKQGTLETPLERWGQKAFHEIPTKTTEQRPTLWTTERNTTGVVLKVWPVPSDNTYSAVMLVSKKIEDITASYQRIDLPTRYLPLIVKWLTYELSLTKQNMPMDVKMVLKQEYLDVLPDTFDEDRERADMHLIPGGISGW